MWDSMGRIMGLMKGDPGSLDYRSYTGYLGRMETT